MFPVPRPVRLLALLLCALLAGCAEQAPPDGGAGREVREAVAAWSRQPPAALAGIPLEDWSYEVTDVPRAVGAQGGRVPARLRYRLQGYDAAPVEARRSVEVRRVGDRYEVLGDRPAEHAPPQLWDQGPVETVKGEHSLVLGTGRPAGELARVAGEADRAVPAASAAWPRAWARRVVVLVPASLDAMASLLGRPAAEYRGLGAVTTGSTGGGPAPADRVVINPEGYAELSEAGRGIVLTHEVTHVATRAATSASTPQWLSEGFADWAAYRGSATTAARAAPALARAVRRGEVPAELPREADFAFGGDQDTLARAYEGAWLACRLVADRWGDEALVRLYEHAGRESLPAALDRTLGVDEAALTRDWRAALREELR
ncbi:hypothetical protein OOK31_23575 [Streptomyces sp. NBC_00249]|uniref:hypothetical protein n=1 Tax=Streptomyces sp. NBC_00249 TaxID=2975690 RepID=UPI0022546391|nr:hypothetical protein [Streptomyces sp. NBC_00249]MCX5196838.1 hypothetical protein [Streptomyces sp. NBC_00249]